MVKKMETKVEIVKCHKPNMDVPMCRQCQRRGESKNNTYESFNLRESRMNGWFCDGYVSEKEVFSLFD